MLAGDSSGSAASVQDTPEPQYEEKIRIRFLPPTNYIFCSIAAKPKRSNDICEGRSAYQYYVKNDPGVRRRVHGKKTVGRTAARIPTTVNDMICAKDQFLCGRQTASDPKILGQYDIK